MSIHATQIIAACLARVLLTTPVALRIAFFPTLHLARAARAG